VSLLMAVGYVNAVSVAKFKLIACQIRSQLLKGNREELDNIII
jgi:peroxiredoxin family protein